MKTTILAIVVSVSLLGLSVAAQSGGTKIVVKNQASDSVFDAADEVSTDAGE
jgi:hypothetical protein